MISSMQFGLRLKLTAALIAAVVLTVVSAGYFTIRNSYQALKHQKQQDELVMAKNIAAQVDEVLSKAKQTVEALASHPAIQSMDASKQREALTLVTKVTELIDGILVMDLDGKKLVLDQAEPDTRRLLPESPYRQFVLPVRRAGAARFSEIYKSRTGEVTAAISAPIYQGTKLVGVIAGCIFPKNHSMGGIEGIRIGKSGYAYIVDAQGNIIVHPQKEKLLENFSANPAVQQLLKKREGVIEFLNQESLAVLAAFAPIQETGWGVVVRQPTSESYAYADHMLYFLTLVFFLSLAGALLIGVYMAKQIARPVTILVEGVRQVAEGRLDLKVPSVSRDEMGELAGAFNDMTAKLKRNTEETARAHQQVLQTQKQLAQSEKMAAIGQLAAGLAHEIYNPLNVISGFSDFLLEKPASDEQRKQHLEDISRETSRCQKLVAELLHFAKPKEPERVPSDVNQLVSETLTLLQSQAKSQGIDVEPRLSKDIPVLALDRDQIKQVVLNLFLNACQAMPEGGKLIVETSRVNGRMEIAVKDTGVGIKEENLGNIFNPFFTTKEHGTGLGLALSYAMVERHGGTIRVDSRPGEGSTFTVSLPVIGASNGKRT